MRLRKTFWLVVISVAFVLGGSIAYCIAGFYRGPTPEEFAVYAAFLVQLSADGMDHVGLGDRSSKLVAPTGESWTPVELRPDPPEKAAPPAHFVEFCGSICADDFMKQNLRSWQLKPSSEVQFPFPVIPAHLESPEGKRIAVTRPGFDLLHRRAVFSYSFDCSAGATPGQDAVVCIQMGDVLMDKANGKWRVASYSATVL
jgi:hypothetical protein